MVLGISFRVKWCWLLDQWSLSFHTVIGGEWSWKRSILLCTFTVMEYITLYMLSLFGLVLCLIYVTMYDRLKVENLYICSIFYMCSSFF